jgi:micrococcal nuclease
LNVLNIQKLFVCASSLFVLFIVVACVDQSDSQVNLNATDTVVKIIDGDTYDVLIDGVQTRIRMEGIDAPERGMDFYKKSKEYLGELCIGQQVKVVGDEKDRYGRLIAKTYLEDGREVGEEMVKAGMAWHFKKYSSDKTLNDLEILAREQRVGLWSMPEPIPPWEHRKQKRKKK